MKIISEHNPGRLTIVTCTHTWKKLYMYTMMTGIRSLMYICKLYANSERFYFGNEIVIFSVVLLSVKFHPRKGKIQPSKCNLKLPRVSTTGVLLENNIRAKINFYIKEFPLRAHAISLSWNKTTITKASSDLYDLQYPHHCNMTCCSRRSASRRHTRVFACVEWNSLGKCICKYVENSLQSGKTVREKRKSDRRFMFSRLQRDAETRVGARGWDEEKMWGKLAVETGRECEERRRGPRAEDINRRS